MLVIMVVSGEMVLGVQLPLIVLQIHIQVLVMETRPGRGVAALLVIVTPQVGILLVDLGHHIVAVLRTLPIVIQNHLMEVGKWHLNKEKISTKNRMYDFLS